MSDFGFGMWAGTAINDTSSVVAAGYSYSEAAGSYATIVKLTRALMIVPVCLFFAMLTARKAKAEGQGFDLKRIFPFFILWFVVASIVNTSGILPAEVSKGLGDFGKFCIVWSMAAIGLNTNLMSLVKNGVRPIFLGLCCWIAVAVVSPQATSSRLRSMWPASCPSARSSASPTATMRFTRRRIILRRKL